MFAPLSVAAKEHVASKLTPLEVEPGEVVVRKGDAGDLFYIVAEGELEISNGVSRTAQGGDVFGEIALLRDVPRTATVTATTPARLFALERDDFLAAVTGQPAAHAAGEALVAERLANA
jgi:CRP-like cAMP-binding protein